MKKSNYNSTNRSKHYLKVHLIFVCKYRKKLLVGQLKDDMKQLLLNIASKSDFEIEVFESDIDHIHFLIRYIPRLSITSIVRKLKQESPIIYGVQFIGTIYILNFGLKKLFGRMVILFALLAKPIQIPLNNIF
jgi:REP element-mobilizing transposase RayT